RHALLVLAGSQRLGAGDSPVGILCAPALARLDRAPQRPRIDLPLVNVPAEFVGLAAVKRPNVRARDAVGEADGRHVGGDVSRVLLVMPQRGQWVFSGRSAMRIR